MKTIFIVDDDLHIRELLTMYFEHDGYNVATAEDGEEALARFAQVKPDAVILDLMLPGMDGYAVCRELRKKSEVPILMLTARGDTVDKVVGLEIGADDYLAKPFEPKELLARVKAVLRRSHIQSLAQEQSLEKAEKVSYDNFVIDIASYTVQFGNQRIEMPPKELELLFFLATHPNRVFTREQLLGQVWGYDFYGESRTVDVHIKRLREKLDEHPHPHWEIRTVWGVGYKFETEEMPQQ